MILWPPGDLDDDPGIQRRGAQAAFARNGAPKSGTNVGTLVESVSLPRLRETSPDIPRFRIIEVPVGPADEDRQGSESLPEP